MHNELTKVDIQKMREEIAERERRIPELLAEVKRTREFGDLSENDEYKTAKREKNANASRIRYLQNMIDTAIIIEVKSKEDEVGLFDTVEVYNLDDEETEVYQIVTTLRTNVLAEDVPKVSKDAPFGRAVLGHKVGDRVTIRVNDTYSYRVEVRKITKGKDDPSIPINTF